ncbi:hypothetical protein J3R82DRAFT_11958 [Butyriboletus roseoflavus]|nr:hypothetical protein J3R82DRAFT_11958 [Butyriboletus roseoflavus]
MMANISLRLLFAHWFTFLEALQQFFWNYTQQPLRLSTVFPELIEDSSTFSPFVFVPRFRDPSDYNNSVDLAARICPVPTILQTPLTTKPFCSDDRSDYDLNDTSSAETSSHSYVVPDIPVWRSTVPHEIRPQTSPSASGGDDHVQTIMAPYGARGLSFCPVLVGIVYTQSLLHLYMLLMDEIPTLFHHWFEDVLGYESLSPTELLDCSRFLHTSLWMAPWYLLRYGVRKVVPCLYRYLRRLGHKSTRPPIPRIVLIRVDGEAVPVNFVEDHQASADVSLWSNLELANLKLRNSLGRNIR